MKEKAEVLVVLLNWNASELTIACVNSLQTWQNSPVDIVVVDNASLEAERTKIKQLESTVKVLYADENKGFSGGTNIGLNYAIKQDYPYVLLLNTDAQITEVIVSGLQKELAKDSRIGIIGPGMQEGGNRGFKTYLGGKDIAYHVDTRNLSTEINQEEGVPLLAVDYVPGTVCMIRASYLESVGLLDENYFFSGEIADFCKRLRTADFKVLVDTRLLISHFTDKTDSKLRAGLYIYYSLRNRFLYSQKHYPKQKKRLYRKWLWVGIRQLVGAVLTLKITTAKALVWAMLDGIWGRFGNRNYRF